MRGTRCMDIGQIVTVGIIPAHAGNTDHGHIVAGVNRDHPRACGEHPVDHMVEEYAGGSSPRMRGTRFCFLVCPFFVGIIPAHAGNTPLRFRRSCLSRDHPRACGEHWCDRVPRLLHGRDHPRACGEHRTASLWRTSLGGSSPRMRGTLDWSKGYESERGIIPAHAENTSRPSTAIF